MKRTLALAWKECHEQAWFTLAGLLIFLGIPVALGITSYYQGNDYFWSNEGAGVAVVFGGVFAIVLAVAATCRDLSGQTYIFWRSRPIGLLRLLAVKYAVGLLALLLTTWAGLLFVMYTYLAAFPGRWYHTGAFGIGLLHSPVLILIFSIAFLLGCLVRQAARAAMLALLAAMLIYFLPLLLPSLVKFSFFTILDQRPWDSLSNTTRPGETELMRRFGITDIGQWRQMLVCLPLLLAGLIGGVIAFAAACTATARSWHLRADKKALSWSLVIVVLGLMAAALVQVGSNMKCKASYTLASNGTPGRFQVFAVSAGGQEGVLMAHRFERRGYATGVFAFSVKDSALCVGPFESLCGEQAHLPHFSWSPQDPRRLYWLAAETKTIDRRVEAFLELVTSSLAPDSAGAVVHRLDLSPELTDDFYGRLARAGQRLYIYTRYHLLTLDISNADAPRVVSNVRRGYEYQGRFDQGATIQSLPLLPLEGLSVRERLAVTAELYWRGAIALDGDLLVQVSGGQSVDVYRWTIGQGERVEAKWLGRYAPSPLEQIITFHPSKVVVARDGIAYLLDHNGMTMMALDVRGPAIRCIGHYRSGREFFNDMALLGDGSILLAGSTVEIIAPAKLKD